MYIHIYTYMYIYIYIQISMFISISTVFRGLGDARVGPLIEIIQLLPEVSSIDLCDNRLTDEVYMNVYSI
jgi:hypothetical protein